MKREFSAGGIIFKKEGDKYYFLVIRNKSLRNPRTNYWGFPKGHLEEGESSLAAALREVKEETGVEVKVVGKIGSSQYIFTTSEGKEKVFKTVTMFLMEYLSGEIIFQVEELMEAKWVEEKEALELLSFPNDKKLLKKGVLMLHG